MLPEVKLKDFRIGSQFWVLERKHARLVVGDKMIWAKFKQPCVRADSCYAEENYFSTLIHLWDLQDATSATLTHVDWRNHTNGHPRMYKANEVGPLHGYDEINGKDLVVRRRKDPFLFARKFSLESVPALLRIAEEVIVKE
ncbi:hypothetical protein MANES_03G014600v8 [Manihot esculenta]|uniref:Uncharacterized protein n=1 Tax=Manihot esculenta TaxID=3983 RepID=A0A2C9W3M1_MANES|nr:hypothetical protein MANES_03G014600v8 [Manihot esculenta]